MMIAIDPGHGMGNTRPGVYDPGAVAAGIEEASVALEYGLTLKQFCVDAGVKRYLTRSGRSDSAPLGRRATDAMDARCTCLVSLHCNKFWLPTAHGVEVLWDSGKLSERLAGRLVKAVSQVTGLVNRGAKRRSLQVCRDFDAGPAVLVELGFLSNQADRRYLLVNDHRKLICRTILGVLLE